MNWDIATAEGMANAVAWQTRHCARIKDGGLWVIPRSGSIYQINNTNKIARRYEGFAPEPAVEKVFKAMGWEVVS